MKESEELSTWRPLPLSQEDRDQLSSLTARIRSEYKMQARMQAAITVRRSKKQLQEEPKKIQRVLEWVRHPETGKKVMKISFVEELVQDVKIIPLRRKKPIIER